MWRTYLICVLVGLLIAAVVGGATLVRQVGVAQSDAERQRHRAVAAESTQSSLQQQVDQRKVATPAPRAASATPGVPAPTVAPVLSVHDLLRQMEDQVSSLRGLQLKRNVPLRFLDQPALQQYFVDRF